MNTSKIIAMSAIAAAMIGMTGCGGGASSSGTTTTPTAAPTSLSCDPTVIDEILTGDITGRTLFNGTTYGLEGKVRLTSGTLTIEPGTTIAGCSPASYLLIKPGAQIDANGISDANPITFTSQKDLKGLSAAGQTGEWGGLILLGNAFTDRGVVQYEAGDADDTFGSVDHLNDADSSGTLNYVLIKHTGYEVELDKELNGLSLAGVGSGTTVSNIAIVGGSDDGLEIWGGAVDVSGLYVTNAKDDSVDVDLGYRGNISNVYVKQNLVDKTNGHDSATIESGNDSNLFVVDDTDATKPVITNFTADIIGAGIYMKNDAGLDLTDAVFRSDKADLTADHMVAYRTLDVVATGAMHATTVCFDNSLHNPDTDVTTFADANTKDADANTAFTDWTGNANLNTGYALDACPDRTAAIAAIWKGATGSDAAVE